MRDEEIEGQLDAKEIEAILSNVLGEGDTPLLEAERDALRILHRVYNDLMQRRIISLTILAETPGGEVMHYNTRCTNSLTVAGSMLAAACIRAGMATNNDYVEASPLDYDDEEED